MLDRLRIAPKLLIGFGVVLVLLVGIAAFGLRSAGEIRGMTRQVKERDFQVAVAVVDLANAAQRVQFELAAAAESASPEALERARDGGEKIRERASAVRSRLPPEGPLSGHLAAFETAFARSFDRGREAAAFAIDQEMLDFIRVRNEYAAELQGFEKALAAMREGSSAALYETLGHIEEVSTRTTSITGWFSAAGVLLGVFIATWIGRRIATPVRHLEHRLRDIAEGEGDLTLRVPVTTRDEVGEAARWFNLFVEKIQTLVGHATENCQVVASSAGQLAATAQELRAGAGEQARQVQEVATAVAEMSTTNDDVARNAASTAQVSSRVRERAEHGQGVVRRTEEGMQAVAETVRTISGAVEELGASCEEIGSILTTIDDIADQTNLLALNATIEAARAGEQGRGFAVVADEVRKLAEKTGRATGEISRMIGKLRADTRRSLDAMRQGLEQTDAGVALAAQAREALGEILSVSDSGLEMARMIAAAAEEQSAVSRQVVENVEAIAGVARFTEGAVGEITGAADRLAGLSAQLQDVLGRFRIESHG
ncbi:MAG: methyl-accepting chemotaxis protein [Thermodesulfobacteriota bacterium]